MTVTKPLTKDKITYKTARRQWHSAGRTAIWARWPINPVAAAEPINRVSMSLRNEANEAVDPGTFVSAYIAVSLREQFFVIRFT